ncbi:MAG: hypothetical protein VX747_12655, partial [Actinomycetota bacterium]|nr:hypothetical protein [Actinomycetota bacterium]
MAATVVGDVGSNVGSCWRLRIAASWSVRGVLFERKVTSPSGARLGRRLPARPAPGVAEAAMEVTMA